MQQNLFDFLPFLGAGYVRLHPLFPFFIFSPPCKLLFLFFPFLFYVISLICILSCISCISGAKFSGVCNCATKYQGAPLTAFHKAVQMYSDQATALSPCICICEQGLPRSLKLCLQNWQLQNLWAFFYSREVTIYWGNNHKHVFTYWNQA